MLTNETPHSGRSHSALFDEPSVSQISSIARQAIRSSLLRPQEAQNRMDYSRMTSTVLQESTGTDLDEADLTGDMGEED